MSGKSAGIGLSVLALAAAGCAGAVYWQGIVFDEKFEDVVRRLSDEGAKTGVLVSAEETGRGFAYRDIAITVKVKEDAYRWTGRADFGVGISAKLTLDKSYGRGAKLEEEGILGFEDELTAKSGLFSPKGVYAWHVKPFKLAKDGVVCSMRAIDAEGDDRLANSRIVWQGLTCGGNGEEVESGEVLFALKAQGEGLPSGVVVTGKNLRSKNGDTMLTVSDYAFDASLNTSTSEIAEKPGQSFYDQTWTLKLGEVSVDSLRVFDAWTMKARLVHMPKHLVDVMSAANMDAYPAVTAALVKAVEEEGLRMELDDCTFRQGEKNLVVLGRIAKDDARYGAFSLTMDKDFIAVPQWQAGVAWLQNLGVLKDTDGKLTSHVELTHDALRVNGVKL